MQTERIADFRARQTSAPTPGPVARAHFVEPVLYPEAQPFDGNPRICHPDSGWGSIVLVTDSDMRVRFGDTFFAWFRLDDAVVAQWPVEGAAELVRWVRRAA